MEGGTRANILAMLEGSDGWCSGEDISSKLGISRAAVGKHIAMLRAEGHAIEAVTRRGYKLLAVRDNLCERTLTAGLNTTLFGKHGWHILETTSSTNLEAMRLAGEGAEEGTVVFAEKQTKGRGRKGYTWISLPRSLQFSVLVRPEASSWNTDVLTSLCSAAVADVLSRSYVIPAKYKKPNDVYCNGKKMAGILVETVFRGTEPEWGIVGVGCNINAVLADFPEGSDARFTSVLRECGHPVNRSQLLRALLEGLEQAYMQLR